MELWPDAWGSPLSNSSCRDVTAAGSAQCDAAVPSERGSTPSRFEEAMASNGVLVLAADSRVIWPALYQSFGDLLNATRWKPWDDPHSPPLLSMSYISKRVPNVFCAQPTFDATGCGAYDVVLLFRNSPVVWNRACACALNDACGRSLCSTFGWAGRKAQRQRMKCPTSSEELSKARKLCNAPGGFSENAGRCLVKGSSGGEIGSSSALEDAMRLFQRACHELLDTNTTFATMPTCFGRNQGQLHNELQFSAKTTGQLGGDLQSALLGVAAIGVGGLHANASTPRICRARRLAASLQSTFMPHGHPLEVWRFEMDPSLTPAAPQLYTAPIFRSKAHSCVGGGGNKTSDFVVKVAPPVWNKRRRLYHRPRPVGPVLPHASYWGYYVESEQSWALWSRFK